MVYYINISIIDGIYDINKDMSLGCTTVLSSHCCWITIMLNVVVFFFFNGINQAYSWYIAIKLHIQ